MNYGRIVSSKGLDIAVEEYEDHFSEEHMPYSTTLHTSMDGEKTIFTGPLARFNLNFESLTEEAKMLAREIKIIPHALTLSKVCWPEWLKCFMPAERQSRIIEGYEYPEAVKDHVEPKSGTGHAVTEAPRGILYHSYSIDEKGIIRNAKIVAPTSHNQKVMEQDLRLLVERYHKLNDRELTERCESGVRNYDPCISCSTHFLNVNIERER